MASATPVVVVTGANGLVGSHVCAALSERGATVRALVRRAGTAPELPGVEEVVGDFADGAVAADVLTAADVVITTVHPMAGDREAQEQLGVRATVELARAAADAGVELLVHISTCAVYDRSPGAGEIDESSRLVGDDAGDYPVTKRDLDLALADVEGITRVLLRPPAILGPGESSVWNTLRPAWMRDGEGPRTAVPDASWPWVHVDDLAGLAADIATGRIAAASDPDDGPVPGACTAVNVAAPTATWRDYLGAVTTALGVEPVWDDAPTWTGSISTSRATSWGWAPSVPLGRALEEIATSLRS